MRSAKGRLAAALACVLLAAADEAAAHAFLDHATPRVGSTVHASPAAVTLQFSEELEGAFCTVSVLDASGKRVDRGDKAVTGDDHATLSVSLPALPAGTYRVVWRVLSVDSHVSQGDFSFAVQP